MFCEIINLINIIIYTVYFTPGANKEINISVHYIQVNFKFWAIRILAQNWQLNFFWHFMKNDWVKFDFWYNRYMFHVPS